MCLLKQRKYIQVSNANTVVFCTYSERSAVEHDGATQQHTSRFKGKVAGLPSIYDTFTKLAVIMG